MSNILKNLKIFTLTAVILAAFVAKAAPLAGSGSSADPFVVASEEDLLDFAASVNAGESIYNDYGVTVALAADLDLTGIAFPGIGTEDVPFFGTFDGCGHTIANLTVENTDEEVWGVGFINCLGNWEDGTPGTLCNTRFFNFSVLADDYDSSSVGIVGECDAGVIENVIVNGLLTILGGREVGALVGWADIVELSDCEVSVAAGSSVTGTCRVGGLLGCVDSVCVIHGCSVSAELTVLGSCDYDRFVGDAYCELEIEHTVFNGTLKKFYHENDLANARYTADVFAKYGIDCTSFSDKNLDLVKFIDWLEWCGIRTTDEIYTTPHLFEAYAFNLPFDAFVNGKPSMSIDIHGGVPDVGWTTIVLHVRAGDVELDVDTINANVFVKHGDSLEDMEEVLLDRECIEAVTDEAGHTRTALVIAPPAGSSHFFKVSVR